MIGQSIAHGLAAKPVVGAGDEALHFRQVVEEPLGPGLRVRQRADLIPRAVGSLPRCVEFPDRPVLLPEPVHAGDAGRLPGAAPERVLHERLVPVDLIVDEDANHPRVFLVRHGPLQTLHDGILESGNERIDDLVAEGRILAAQVQDRRKRRAPVFHQFLIGPRADCVHTPLTETPVEPLAGRFLPRGTEGAHKVGHHEAYLAVLHRVFHGLIRGIGQPLEHGLTPRDRRDLVETDAVGAVGEKEPALGIDEPPLALNFFQAEKAGGLQLRAAGPSAELAERSRTIVASGCRQLFGVPLLQFIFGVHLPGPLQRPYLTKLVEVR